MREKEREMREMREMRERVNANHAYLLDGNVSRLNIPVNYTRRVNVFKAAEDLVAAVTVAVITLAACSRGTEASAAVAARGGTAVAKLVNIHVV